MAKILVLSVIVFVGLLYVQTEETKTDEGTDLVKRLIESLEKKSEDESHVVTDAEKLETEERQVLNYLVSARVSCPGPGIKAFLYELNNFVYGKMPLYGWKRCFNVNSQAGCGVNEYCCRHPFGDNVCYKRKYLIDNRKSLSI